MIAKPLWGISGAEFGRLAASASTVLLARSYFESGTSPCAFFQASSAVLATAFLLQKYRGGLLTRVMTRVSLSFLRD
jgi:hypothetical protein